MSARRDGVALAGLLAATGTLHLPAPAPFDSIVPRIRPGRTRAWTYLSGAAGFLARARQRGARALQRA